MQYGRFKFVLAIIASLQQTIVNRSPVFIYADREEHWHRNSREIKLVSPFLLLTSWSMNYVLDLWCYKYLCRKGDVVIDVGAGVGDDTVAFSRLVGKSGRVIAIEAHPATYQCLLKTIEENKLENVVCVNVALSDTSGFVSFSDDKLFMGNTFLVEGGRIKVKVTTLIELLDELGLTGANFLKMNIEGAEAHALRGMRKILKSVPNIVISCHDFRAINGEPDGFRTLAGVSEVLAEAGYRSYRRHEDQREEVPFYVYGTLDDPHSKSEKPVLMK